MILDINMPLKNGFEVLVNIRHDDQICNVPVIMYSTASDENTINTAFYLGASLYAIKPSSQKKMVDRVHRIAAIRWENFTANRNEFILH